MSDRGIDIVVTSPSGHADVVVEVKLGGDLEAATSRLSEYMRRVGAPVGLVVGHERIRILRDTFRGSSSIKVAGDFPVSLAPSLRKSSNASEFEEHVQTWLESLRDGSSNTAEPLSSALAEHVLPSIAEGTVRAAGPRARSAAG
jgi:hypothetical protein